MCVTINNLRRNLTHIPQRNYNLCHCGLIIFALKKVVKAVRTTPPLSQPFIETSALGISLPGLGYGLWAKPCASTPLLAKGTIFLLESRTDWTTNNPSFGKELKPCLLYTSDAADDWLVV